MRTCTARRSAWAARRGPGHHDGMRLNARYIADAVSVPVIADADNGCDKAIGVIRAVCEYIQTGVAGIRLKDPVIPKRCGHVAGRMVIPLEEGWASTALRIESAGLPRALVSRRIFTTRGED